MNEPISLDFYANEQALSFFVCFRVTYNLSHTNRINLPWL